MLAPPDNIYNEYWGDGTGRSTLEQQVSNLTCNDDCGISKVDRVLQFVPKTGRNFLEIGCAPGELLRQMLERNWDVYGIEPSPNYVEFICRHAPGANVWCGYFPQITKTLPDNSFDCIVALDVFEHLEDYESFIMELRRLLRPKARAILMSPIIYEDGLIRKTEFIPNEHAYIFTKKFLQEYLSEFFSEVKFTRWIVSHELIILNK
jgi:2-polyprenyl-3-methyl-5-hydroxy-6-metoxy-1,4-benzoquinol methylase